MRAEGNPTSRAGNGLAETWDPCFFRTQRSCGGGGGRIYFHGVWEEELEEERRHRLEDIPGWDDKKVLEVIEYYDDLTDEEAIDEAEAALAAAETTLMVIPRDLVAEVQELIARHAAEHERKLGGGTSR